MVTLRNKQNLIAVSRETQEITTNSLLQNTFVPGITEEYITQFSEEIESRVIKKPSINLVEQSHVFWVLCPSLTNFSWTLKYGHFPEPFREDPGLVT